MTDEQLAAILGMENLGSEEKKLAMQQAMSRQLRESALRPSAGKDFGSQLARGLQGAMAGYGMKQDMGRLDEFGKKQDAALGSMRDALLNRGGGAQAQAPAPMQPPPTQMPPQMPGQMPPQVPPQMPPRRRPVPPTVDPYMDPEGLGDY